MKRIRIWWHILFKCTIYAYEESYYDLLPLKGWAFPERIYYCGVCHYGGKRNLTPQTETEEKK